MKFNLHLADPDTTSDCFWETMDSVSTALTLLGHTVTRSEAPQTDAINIVFGFHVNPQGIKRRSIVYQLEPVASDTILRKCVPISYLKNHIVWDYSRRNISLLEDYGVHAEYVPICCMPESSVPRDVPKTIDVLYYGNVTPYRRRVIDAIKARGLKIVEVFGLYRTDLDELLAKSKVVLNIHNSDDFTTLESVRIMRCLQRGKAVVTEMNAGDDDDGLLPFVCSSAYPELAKACEELAADDAQRIALEQKSSEVLVGRDLTEILPVVLSRIPQGFLGTECPPLAGRYAKDGCTIMWQEPRRLKGN